MFCLPLVLLGLVWSPRRILLAFLAGRRSQSLHGLKVDDLVARPLSMVREVFPLPTQIHGTSRDYLGFGVLIAGAAVVCLIPLVIGAGIWIVMRLTR